MQNLYPPSRQRQVTQTELRCTQDVLLLLSNMAEREEATVKAVLDCLYDVGSIHLINQRVGVPPLRWPLQGVAHFSKPVFRLFAWRWFKRNCPTLLTKWLIGQVQFGDKALPPTNGSPDAIDVVPVRAALPPLVEKQAQEIMALRDRIGWLTLVVVVLAVVVCITLTQAA